MNFKKLKLWKLLAVGGVVGLVATVPIITTACSTITKEEDSIIDDTNVVKEIKLNENITSSNPVIVKAKFSDLIKTNESSLEITETLLEKNLSDIINKSEETKKDLIYKYDVIKKYVGNIILENVDEIGQWGTDKTWIEQDKKPKTLVYYHFGLGPLTISSISDLKTQIDGKLDEIMKQSLENNPYSEFSLVNDSALLVDANNNYLRIHVQGTKTTKDVSVDTNIELRIPVSDINYQPSKVNIKILSKSQSITGLTAFVPTYIKSVIGIDQTTRPTKESNEKLFGGRKDNTNQLVSILGKDSFEIDTETKYGKVTAKSLAQHLGWYKESQNQENKNNVKDANALLTLDGANINSHNVAKSLNVFNVDFTKLTLKPSEGSVADSSSNQYNGKFDIELTGKPSKGYYWDDGKDDERVVVLKDLNVLLEDAIFENESLFASNTNFEFNDIGHTTINKPNNNPSFSDFFNEQKIDELIKILNNKLNEKGSKSVGVKVVFDKNYKINGYTNGINSTTQQIVIKVIPKDGHMFPDYKKDVVCEISLTSWKK